jgi:prevent-host-death family protein
MALPVKFDEALQVLLPKRLARKIVLSLRLSQDKLCGMERTINAKQLRLELPDLVRRVQRGERFTVLYRSRPAFRIVGVNDADVGRLALEDDPVYRAQALGASSDGMKAADHDSLLYGLCRSPQ